MDLQSFTNSSFSLYIAYLISKLPEGVARPVINFIADRFVSRKNSSLIRSVRSNQWVVHREQITADELDRHVYEVVHHAARCYYDLYHNLHDPEGLKSLVPFDSMTKLMIEKSQDRSQGAIVVGPHLSNFDLILLAGAYHGLKAQALSFGQPPGGYKVQNRIRAATGLNITPISYRSLSQALDYIKRGGLVITGVDRPIGRDRERLTFFGRQTYLPTGHIRLAMKAEVPVYVAGAQLGDNGKYFLHLSDPIHMKKHSSRSESIRINAEKVLRVVENYIQLAPKQWLMFFPVWPETVNQTP
ncbi:MAG: lysophospholipid acyltransferase family protein [Anaerolineales bacterium]|jgi:KDO2-lipid IV(A) lauroyltransferase